MKTDSALCVGCNKCIFKCPTHANDAVLEDNNNKINVNNDLCIFCGECIDICDHGARSLDDDTLDFFDALKRGEEISVIAAPAIRHNIPEYEHLFGYLHSLGVGHCYDVSFGADITTWGYLKAIRENHIDSMIAQPCPVVVQYIEKYKPELISRLAPVQSPALCTAVYMKKYAGVTGKIAFLSPCIGKTTEFSDPNTGGNVSYNVTYKRLLEYLENNQIDLSQYKAEPFENVKGSMGVTFSRPGGLKENVYLYAGENVWVKQIEGIDNLMYYFNEYANRIKDKKPVPLLVDALNCEHGCNLGTATTKALSIDDIDYATDRMKLTVDREHAEKLMKHFDETLTLSDFMRSYTDKSSTRPIASPEAVEQVFLELGKCTERERSVNCFSCGFGNCRDFANAVALSQNHKENCFQYARRLLAEQAQELEQRHNTIITSINYASKIQRNLLPPKTELDDAFSDYSVIWKPKDIVGGDIYWLKNFAEGAVLCVCDCTGHGTPGALLSMLVVSAFEAAVNERNYKDTAAIIWGLEKKLVSALNVTVTPRKEGEKRYATQFNDGCDLAVLYIARDGAVTISAGHTHVFVCDGKDVQQYKGQRIHVGDGSLKSKDEINMITIPGNPDNKYYVASDGLYDQIGTNGKKFGYKTLKEIILNNHQENQNVIIEKIWRQFEVNRESEIRRDDVSLVGFTP